MAIGFASIVLYMGLTLFYPLLQFDEFVRRALRDNVQNQMVDRYMHYVSLMTFGVISVVVGNLAWHYKKKIGRTPLLATTLIFSIIFILLIIKFVVDLEFVVTIHT